MNIRGFTLIEIMVVLSLSLLLLFTSASFYKTLQRIQTTLTLYEMSSLLNRAKFVALLLQQPIVLCPSQDGKQCGKRWQGPYYLIQSQDGQTKINFKSQFNAKWRCSSDQLIFRPYQVFGSTNNSIYLYDNADVIGVVTLSKMARVRVSQ